MFFERECQCGGVEIARCFIICGTCRVQFCTLLFMRYKYIACRTALRVTIQYIALLFYKYGVIKLIIIHTSLLFKCQPRIIKLKSISISTQLEKLDLVCIGYEMGQASLELRAAPQSFGSKVFTPGPVDIYLPNSGVYFYKLREYLSYCWPWPLLKGLSSFL